MIDPKHKPLLNLVVHEYVAALNTIIQRKLDGDVRATALAGQVIRAMEQIKTIVESEDDRIMAGLYVGVEASRLFGGSK